MSFDTHTTEDVRVLAEQKLWLLTGRIRLENNFYFGGRNILVFIHNFAGNFPGLIKLTFY